MGENTFLSLDPRDSCEIGPISDEKRIRKACQIRVRAASFQRDLPLPGHPCNGDEELYPNKIANFSKALPHNQLGEVKLRAYKALMRALSTGDMHSFEAIPLGGAVKLGNPQAAYAYDLVGPDSHHLALSPAPAFSSDGMAGDMTELYWQALTRDVPYADFETNPLTIAAAADLSSLSVFDGPKVYGVVTPQTLFRGNAPGCLSGPYISQLLMKEFPLGAKTVDQRYRTAVAGVDYMTSYDAWLNIENGSLPSTPGEFDPVPHYIRNGRDLGEYVHWDFPYQAVLTACLILLGFGDAALAPGNPYLNSRTQVGFATFGAPHILDFAAKAARLALEAAWFQKWLVHRRLRPEEFGGRVHNMMTGTADYPISEELLNSKAVSEVFSKYGTYLLPQAYPGGCPAHPSYPAAHSCYIGAGVTMLKAFFNEYFVIPDPVEASSDGLSLLPFTDGPLTVGGELNKLAANISLGRDAAGLHYRSDMRGLYLGERAAIGILRDYKRTYNEKCTFFFTKFNGTTVKI